jgi:glycosyltransferase-like protein LARGE
VAGFGGANMQVPSINGSSEETLIDILFRFHREVETVRSGCILDLELVVQDVASWDDPALTKYPVNAVRNRALQLVRTDGVLLLDADFLPAASLVNSYQASSTAYAALMQQLLLEKAAIVLPAFGHADYQPLPDGTDARMAKDAALLNSKESMALAYSSGIMPSFYEMENPRDHGATNFSRWITATAPYEIVYERMFEPYVLVAKKYVPWFDERFIGYYRNKVEHLEHMYSLGVKYKVHPYAFVLHRPHLKSATFQATEALTGNADHMAKMIRTHEAIQAEIANGTFVPVTSFGHRCPAHVPVEGARIVAVLTEKTKWMRANRAGSTV